MGRSFQWKMKSWEKTQVIIDPYMIAPSSDYYCDKEWNEVGKVGHITTTT